jgi:hypothetical protein
MTRFLLLALAAVAVFSFPSAALARTGDDERCRGGFDENNPEALKARTVPLRGHRELHCTAVFDIAKSSGERVPADKHAPDCPGGSSIRDTSPNGRPTDLDWDYFVLHNDWVTWDPGAGLHLTYHRDGSVKNMRPAFFNHNARHSFPVRVFFVCEPDRV